MKTLLQVNVKKRLSAGHEPQHPLRTVRNDQIDSLLVLGLLVGVLSLQGLDAEVVQEREVVLDVQLCVGKLHEYRFVLLVRKGRGLNCF